MFANPGFTNGVFTNSSIDLLGVGWLERTLETNLYNTLSQQLITYSQAKDDLFLSSGGKVIVGGYSLGRPLGRSNVSSNTGFNWAVLQRPPTVSASPPHWLWPRRMVR